jgi:MFS transporter, ACS family, DAL5 transporter family protein
MDKSQTKSSVRHFDQAIDQVCDDARPEQFTPAEEKKLIRRIDRRLVTALGLLYMCSLMDRTNLSIANIAG